MREIPAGGQPALARVDHCHWSDYVGVSLQESQATMQVMLGMSLRARWDVTPVLVTTVVNRLLQILTTVTRGLLCFSDYVM